jgi:hypothetical protein
MPPPGGSHCVSPPPWLWWQRPGPACRSRGRRPTPSPCQATIGNCLDGRVHVPHVDEIPPPAGLSRTKGIVLARTGTSHGRLYYYRDDQLGQETICGVAIYDVEPVEAFRMLSYTLDARAGSKTLEAGPRVDDGPAAGPRHAEWNDRTVPGRGVRLILDPASPGGAHVEAEWRTPLASERSPN